MPMTIADLRKELQEAACQEIAAATMPEGSTQAGDLCRYLRRIENCRCGLAIFRAASRRSLLGGQHQMLGDIAWILYRLSRRCHSRCCAARMRNYPSVSCGCDLRGKSIFEMLEAVIGESLEHLDRGGRIDREISGMEKLCRALCRVFSAAEEQSEGAQAPGPGLLAVPPVS